MSYQPQNESRLLALPREIRDLIYEFTFTCQRVQIGRDIKKATHRTAGLAITCKQLRNETILLYYRLTTFIGYQSDSIKTWLAVLRPECISVVSMLIREGPGYWDSVAAARTFLPRFLGSPAGYLRKGVVQVQVRGLGEEKTRTAWA